MLSFSTSYYLIGQYLICEATFVQMHVVFSHLSQSIHHMLCPNNQIEVNHFAFELL